MENRVWIYNASIILEFLDQTLMPTRMFLKGDGIQVQPGNNISKGDLKDFSILNDYSMSADELYNLYLLFRESKPYTIEIETKYKFKLILSKVKFFSNGWEFIRMRRGREQVIHFAPVMLRSKASAKLRDQYPPTRKIDLSKGQVPVTMEDLQGDH